MPHLRRAEMLQQQQKQIEQQPEAEAGVAKNATESLINLNQRLQAVSAAVLPNPFLAFRNSSKASESDAEPSGQGRGSRKNTERVWLPDAMQAFASNDTAQESKPGVNTSFSQ
jgi:hypothetical protein